MVIVSPTLRILQTSFDSSFPATLFTSSSQKTSQAGFPELMQRICVTASTQDGRTAPSMNKIQVNDVYYPGVDRTEVTA